MVDGLPEETDKRFHWHAASLDSLADMRVSPARVRAQKHLHAVPTLSLRASAKADALRQRLSYGNGRRHQIACFERDSTPLAIGYLSAARCRGA
jgi:hypothetical protein